MDMGCPFLYSLRFAHWPKEMDVSTHAYGLSSAIKFCRVVEFFLDVSMVELQNVIWLECKLLWVKLLVNGNLLPEYASVIMACVNVGIWYSYTLCVLLIYMYCFDGYERMWCY